MYTRDDTQVIREKRQASFNALQSLKLMLRKKRDELQDVKKSIPDMLKEEFTEKFVLALMKCHQLTLYLLAHDLAEYLYNIETWFCPLSYKYIIGVVIITYYF